MSNDRVLGGRNEVPVFTRLTSRQQEDVNLRTTQFGEIITAQQYPLIELKSIYGYSDLRDVSSSMSGGYCGNDRSEYILSSSAVGSLVILDSAERGRYIPGMTGEAGIGIRYGSLPTGTQVYKYGLYDNNDGYYFMEHTGGLYAVVRNSGSETYVHRDDWNSDKLDGNGLSRYNLNPLNGHIYQIKFAWYGYGAIEFIVDTFGDRNIQEPTIVHRKRIEGGTSTGNPNLPIRAEVQNGSTSATGSLFVAGRKYCVYGNYNPYKRYTSYKILNQSIGTSPSVLFSARRKSGSTRGAVNISRVEIITNGDATWDLIQNGSLSGVVWETPANIPTSETVMEFAATGTISGGITVYSGFANNGGRNQNGLTDAGLPSMGLIEDRPASIVIRTLTSTATVSAIIIIEEDW